MTQLIIENFCWKHNTYNYHNGCRFLILFELFFDGHRNGDSFLNRVTLSQWPNDRTLETRMLSENYIRHASQSKLQLSPVIFSPFMQNLFHIVRLRAFFEQNASACLATNWIFTLKMRGNKAPANCALTWADAEREVETGLVLCIYFSKNFTLPSTGRFWPKSVLSYDVSSPYVGDCCGAAAIVGFRWKIWRRFFLWPDRVFPTNGCLRLDW